jgi:MULE transposase domain
MSLLPPSETTQYTDRKAMIAGLQVHARDNGYAIIIRRSNPRDGTIYFKCDRGGQYQARNGINDTNRKRDTGTRLIGCPFSVRANLKDGIWTIKVRDADHNHEATKTAVSHPIQHRLTPTLKQQVKDLSTAGITAREIVSTVRQSTDHAVLVSDIYNMRKQLRLENLAGKTPTEALVTILTTSQYVFNYRTDEIGRVTHLFFAHPRSLQLLEQYPDVLLLDCTYKTNRFKMPLLNIVGTTCLNTTFYVAFCFLAKEEKDDYIWAMEQLRNVFPAEVQSSMMVMDQELALMNAIQQVFPKTQQLLCIWHIEKNILVHASKEFEKADDREVFMKAWARVVSSDTEEDYEKNWLALENAFEDSAPGLVLYVKSTWIDLWKRLIVKAFTDKHLYFGNRVTSRVEGAHSTLKSYL